MGRTKNPRNILKYRIIVSNLKVSVKEDDLEEYFSKYGTIVNVVIARDLKNKSLCFGFIDFKNQEEANNAAIQTNNTKLKKSVITVKVSCEKS